MNVMQRSDADVALHEEAPKPQAQTTISSLALEATASLFDALGASATSLSKSLDRHWRNARTITSHNPAHLQRSGCRRLRGEWNAAALPVANRTKLKTAAGVISWIEAIGVNATRDEKS